MKNKLGTILLVLVLMFSFVLNVNAETIKEDASNYDGDVYIIGSSKFDSNIIVTGTMASVAGAREAYVQYVVNQNLKFKPEDLKIYYYSELDETWSKLPATSEETMTELTEQEVEELTENLNIYFVNEVEKTIEVPYEALVDDGYELKFETNDENHNDKVKYENGKLILPATVKKVDVYAVPEEIEEDEEVEEIHLGAVEQIDGEFKNALNLVRTYEELVFAIESDVETIRVEENIDLPTALNISRKVEIYLNSANLTVTEDTVGDGVFKVVTGGHLTIDGEGTINGLGDNDYSMALWANGGEIVINGGTYTNVGAGTDDHYDLIYAKNGGKVTINGGTFEAHTPKWTLNLKDSDGSEIIVKGGTFKNYNPAAVYTEPTQPLNFMAEGYKVIGEDGYYTVVEVTKKDVALINGVAYTSLEDAVNAATSGLTIELIKNIDLETAVVVNKKIVLELNGYDLTVTEDTVGDGVFKVVTGGHLTINGEGTINGLGDNDYSIALWANGGEIVINGGTYTNVGAGTDDHYDLIYAKNGGKVIINGGTFEAHTPKWTLNLKDSDGSEIIVKGGTFKNYNPAEVYTEPTQPLNFLEDGYKVIASGEYYNVVEATDEDVALISGVAYTSLEEAVEKATAGATIKLINDIDLETAVVVDKKIVLELNGHDLTVTEDTAGDGVFKVVTGGHLTINGVGAINGVGNNNYNMAIWANGGEVVINGGMYTNVGAGTDDHYDLIYAKNGGKVTINGGMFEAHTPKWTLNLKDSDGSLIEVKGGVFRNYNPAEVYTEPTQPLNFVAEGYKVTVDETYYTVSELTDEDVAVVNGLTYTKLEDAVLNAKEGSTITLINDIDLKTAVVVNKKIVLELNGHDLTVTEDTVGDGVFKVVTGGHLTIDGEGTINGLGDNDYSMALWANGGEIVINGGTYTNVGAGEEDHYDLIYAKNGGKVTINGGTFEAHTPKWTLNLKDSDGSEIIVKGGTFKNYNPAEVYTEPTQPLNFVAPGYGVSSNEDGSYTVLPIAE